MNKAEIIALQVKVGTKPDGFWGPKSIAATQQYLRDLMPKPNPWPSSSEASLRAFYGAACDEGMLVRIPAPVPMYFDQKKIKEILCHARVADSLSRALTAAYAEAEEVVHVYDGCYNCRPIAGSNTKSLHARGAAIDLDAENNGSFEHWPTSAEMPITVMEAFAREGWTPAGAFWGRDAMHFQATRP